MKIIQGLMSLIISKKVKNELEAVAKFSDVNIYKVEVVVTLMDGSLHSVEVDDHFVKWEILDN